MMNQKYVYSIVGIIMLVVVGCMSLGSALAQDATPELTPEATESLTPCTVSTTVAKSIQVRVGPGENRTSFIFLPENQSFEVLGRAKAAADSLWWKLDRTIVAPKKSAAEAWVAQADVEAIGDCESVVDVNAPPVIPITTGTTNAQPSTGTEVLPQEGLWTITYSNGTMAGTCSKPSSRASLGISWPPERYDLTLASDHSSIIYAGKTFTHVSTNFYSGVTHLTRLSPAPTAAMSLTVRSTTQMNVTLTFNYGPNGATCKFTVSATMTAG